MQVFRKCFFQETSVVKLMNSVEEMKNTAYKPMHRQLMQQTSPCVWHKHIDAYSASVFKTVCLWLEKNQTGRLMQTWRQEEIT